MSQVAGHAGVEKVARRQRVAGERFNKCVCNPLSSAYRLQRARLAQVTQRPFTVW